MILQFSKIHPDAKAPVRAHTWDAGADVFALEAATIRPGFNQVLRTGLRISVPPGHMVQVMNKSGIASKRNFVVGACVIDPGYTGELMIDLLNVSSSDMMDKLFRDDTIDKGEKIAQIVVVPIVHAEFQELTEQQFADIPPISARGEGGFGSTGNN